MIYSLFIYKIAIISINSINTPNIQINFVYDENISSACSGFLITASLYLAINAGANSALNTVNNPKIEETRLLYSIPPLPVDITKYIQKNIEPKTENVVIKTPLIIARDAPELS